MLDPQNKILIITRLTPPAQQTRLLSRDRIDTLLSDAIHFPLTVLVAPAGSGKTTALSGFAIRSQFPIVWCRMSSEDDSHSLLCHLVKAFQVANILPDDNICDMIIQQGTHIVPHQSDAPSPLFAINLLVNHLSTILKHDTLLILDDYHAADEKQELRQILERLITVQPKRLHLLFSTRYHPMLTPLPTARARGEIYQLEQPDIAFTVEETQQLFELYQQTCSVDIEQFNTFCRGWPLVLQLLASNSDHIRANREPFGEQSTQHPQTEYVQDKLVACLHNIAPLLDKYLTQQVLNPQPPEIQDFLVRTGSLRWFDANICVGIPGFSHVISHQTEVERRCLFLESSKSNRFEYQPIFHLFLDRIAQERLSDWHDIHIQAMRYYQEQGDWDNVLYYLLKIHEVSQAAEILQRVAPTWLNQGRTKSVLTWLERLPHAYQSQPSLLEIRAVAYRLTGHFQQALEIYEQAERAFREQEDIEGQARALRGRAEVYLDTVQPAPAEALLDQALALLPLDKTNERAQILLLQAENWANRGRADIAFALENRAHDLIRGIELHQDDHTSAITTQSNNRPFAPAYSLPPRLLLRSGRLHESRQLLEYELGLQNHHSSEKHPTILAHREPLLLLSLIYAMLGNGAKSVAMALRGLLEAFQGGTPYTQAIAHLRIAHAHQVITPIGSEIARQHYQQAIDLIQTFGVTRTKVEFCMGMALLHGHEGNLVEAEHIASEGLQIAELSGDEWIAATIFLALGGAAVSIADTRAIEWLEQANQRFTRGGDTYGQAVVALWKAIWYLREGTHAQAQEYTAILLNLMKHYGYEGLLTARTLFGPRDMAMLIPVLLIGRSLPEYQSLAQQLLRQAFPTIAADETVDNYHPGYTLRIQMFGSFRVWRGQSEIQSREWQREKARQLLQLLLTYRGQWIQREQICSWLWPESDLESSERQFKVTLNALNTALEPSRPPRTSPFFVRRQGLAYSFAPSYGCWIDVDEFELRTTNVPQTDPDFVFRNAQAAINLYQGDYLAESLYDPWTLEERERLLARFLATATALAQKFVEKGEFEQAIQMCERVLRRDRCYEEAYQVLMYAHMRSGSRSQALRTYDRCVHALQDDLGIEPLPETIQIYERMKQNKDP